MNIIYTYIIDIDTFLNHFSLNELIDWKFFYLSDMVINPKISKKFQNWFHKKIDAIKFNRKKCLIVDFDNTLWGGVLGEDGIGGIKLSSDLVLPFLSL